MPSQKLHAPPSFILLFFFQQKSLRGYFYLRKLSLSRSENKLKLLTFDNVSLATVFSLKPVGRSRVKTAIEFSCQNDAGAPARITENLVFVVVPVLESKGLSNVGSGTSGIGGTKSVGSFEKDQRALNLSVGC